MSLKALIQYCLYIRNIVSTWNFISLTRHSGRSRPKVRKTRRDKSPNVGTFFRRLDLAAHYCSADSWRVALEKVSEKEASMRNILVATAERSVARQRPSLGLHFSTSKLLPRRRSHGTLNVRIGKKVTEKNFVPRRPQMDVYKDLKSKV